MSEFLEKIFNYRQSMAITMVPDVLAKIFTSGQSFKQVLACIMFLIQLPFMVIFDTPLPAVGQELNLSGYEMVFCDEFEGDSLNTDVWFTRANGKRRGGFNAASQVQVRNGNAVITGEYLTDGEYGEGWYAGAFALKEKYTYGYYEIRCICNPGSGYWSAFWLQADHPYTPEISQGGIGGAEIDIMEAMSYDNFFSRNGVSQTVHCSGMQGDTTGGLNSCRLGKFFGNDIYEEYNTYGLEWTEDEYIFYVNGVESARTSWADGVSSVPEQLIVSLELPSDIDEVIDDRSHQTEYIIDYVKIYQKK